MEISEKEYEELKERIDFLESMIYNNNSQVHAEMNDLKKDSEENLESLAVVMNSRLDTFDKVIRGLCKTIDDHIHGFHNYFIGGKKNEGAVSGHRRRSKLGGDVQETTLQAGRMEEEEANEGLGTGEEICPAVTEDSEKNLV
jgi:hypothetical protein